jgi:hypothetical protein
MNNKKTKEGEHLVMQKRCGVVPLNNASFKARVHRIKGEAQTLGAQSNASAARVG